MLIPHPHPQMLISDRATVGSIETTHTICLVPCT